MNSIWEKVMSSLRAQIFQRVLIQKVNTKIRLPQVCRVILITPSFRFQRIVIARALLKNAPILILAEVVCTGVYIRSARFAGEVQVKRISRAILESLIHLRMHVNRRAVNAKDIRGKIIVDDTILPSSLATTPTEDGKENRARNGKNPTKGRVRNKTEKIFKHAGKSVGGGIKKVMSGKSSGKSKEEVESSETERLSSVESDSSDAESQPSSVDSPPVDNSSTASSGIENSDTTVRASESIKTPDEVAAGDSNEHHALGQSSSFVVVSS